MRRKAHGREGDNILSGVARKTKPNKFTHKSTELVIFAAHTEEKRRGQRLE